MAFPTHTAGLIYVHAERSPVRLDTRHTLCCCLKYALPGCCCSKREHYCTAVNVSRGNIILPTTHTDSSMFQAPLALTPTTLVYFGRFLFLILSFYYNCWARWILCRPFLVLELEFQLLLLCTLVHESATTTKYVKMTARPYHMRWHLISSHFCFCLFYPHGTRPPACSAASLFVCVRACVRACLDRR